MCSKLQEINLCEDFIRVALDLGYRYFKDNYKIVSLIKNWSLVSKHLKSWFKKSKKFLNYLLRYFAEI